MYEQMKEAVATMVKRVMALLDYYAVSKDFLVEHMKYLLDVQIMLRTSIEMLDEDEAAYISVIEQCVAEYYKVERIHLPNYRDIAIAARALYGKNSKAYLSLANVASARWVFLFDDFLETCGRAVATDDILRGTFPAQAEGVAVALATEPETGYMVSSYKEAMEFYLKTAEALYEAEYLRLKAIQGT